MITVGLLAFTASSAMAYEVEVAQKEAQPSREFRATHLGKEKTSVRTVNSRFSVVGEMAIWWRGPYLSVYIGDQDWGIKFWQNDTMEKYGRILRSAPEGSVKIIKYPSDWKRAPSWGANGWEMEGRRLSVEDLRIEVHGKSYTLDQFGKIVDYAEAIDAVKNTSAEIREKINAHQTGKELSDLYQKQDQNYVALQVKSKEVDKADQESAKSAR